MDAVSASLVRTQCVRLAVALKDRVAEDGSLQAWIDEASADPLPQVRFSLTEPPKTTRNEPSLLRCVGLEVFGIGNTKADVFIIALRGTNNRPHDDDPSGIGGLY